MTDSKALDPTDTAHQLATAIGDVFALDHIVTGSSNGQRIRLHGQLLTESHQAYPHIARQFRDHGYTPVLRSHSGGVTITAIPAVFASRSSGNLAALLLFALTVLSVLFVGAGAQAPDLQWILEHPLAGWPFAASLMAILTAHELGHYFVARRFGVAVSLPYFIPMPFSPFGTMGAVIRTRAPIHNRRQLLAIGAAGPLAGLAVAVPLLVLGLLQSEVHTIPLQPGVFMEGNSLFYAAVKFLLFGQLLPSGGIDVFLHPVAFAAWAGLLVTALNLIPAGQLDGGHIAYALLGRRTLLLNRLAVLLALIMGLIWSGWFTWAAILFFFGQRSAEPLDDVTQLTRRQRAFAICMLLLFAALFTPVPMIIL